MAEENREKILELRRKRNQLWREFCRLPKKGSFSGLRLTEQLDEVQRALDQLEENKRSARYYPEINLE